VSGHRDIGAGVSVMYLLSKKGVRHAKKIRVRSVFDPYYKRSKSSRHAKISSMEIITPLRKMF